MENPAFAAGFLVYCMAAAGFAGGYDFFRNPFLYGSTIT